MSKLYPDVFNDLAKGSVRIPDLKQKTMHRWMATRRSDYRKANCWQVGTSTQAGVPAAPSDVASIMGQSAQADYRGYPILNPYAIGIGEGATLRLLPSTTSFTDLQTDYLVSIRGTLQMEGSATLRVKEWLHNAGSIQLGCNGPGWGIIHGEVHNETAGSIRLRKGFSNLHGSLRNAGSLEIDTQTNMWVADEVECTPGGRMVIDGDLWAAKARILGSCTGDGGRVLADTTFLDGSVLSPGKTGSAGALTFESLTMGSGSRLVLDFAPNNHLDWIQCNRDMTWAPGSSIELRVAFTTPRLAADMAISMAYGKITLSPKVKLILPPGASCSGLAVQNGFLMLKGFSYIP